MRFTRIYFETNQYPLAGCQLMSRFSENYVGLISLIMSGRNFVSGCQCCYWMKLFANELLCCQEGSSKTRVLRELFVKKPSSGIILNRLIRTTNWSRSSKLKCTDRQTLIGISLTVRLWLVNFRTWNHLWFIWYIYPFPRIMQFFHKSGVRLCGFFKRGGNFRNIGRITLENLSRS